MKCSSLFLITFLLFAQTLFGQDTLSRVLKIPELFQLAEQHSYQLSISKDNTKLGAQQLAIARSARLPDIAFNADAEFLSDAAVLRPNFSLEENVKVPHLGNNYGIGVTEDIYRGGAIKHTIEKAKLQEELSKLNYEQDRQTINLLLLNRYLDLYRLYNQQKVYLSNIELAKSRLKNINSLHKQGMVTGNDVIRSELQITDLNVLADAVASDIEIANRDICVTIGLPENTRLMVDTTIVAKDLQITTFQQYLTKASGSRPEILAGKVNETIAEKNISIEKAARLPTLTLFAGDNLGRPFLDILPPQDIYFNLYQVGLKLTYNISSLYRAKDHIQLAQTQFQRQQKQTGYIVQQTELEVNAAFVKYNEATRELERRKKGLQLAEDNYRIVEKRYLNQLAVLTDILDASSAKLSAELDLNNADITIIQQWYRLQKASGQL